MEERQKVQHNRIHIQKCYRFTTTEWDYTKNLTSSSLMLTNMHLQHTWTQTSLNTTLTLVVALHPIYNHIQSFMKMLVTWQNCWPKWFVCICVSWQWNKNTRSTWQTNYLCIKFMLNNIFHSYPDTEWNCCKGKGTSVEKYRHLVPYKKKTVGN